MQPQYAAACRRALVLARLSGMTTSLTRCLHATMPDLYAALKPGPESLDGLHVRTLSQGYTHLQNLVKRLDHRNIASDTSCS